MADTPGTAVARIVKRLRGRATMWSLSAMVGAPLLALLMMEPFVYVLGGEPVAYREMTPRVIDLRLPDAQERDPEAARAGGLITADLDGDGPRDFMVTAVELRAIATPSTTLSAVGNPQIFAITPAIPAVTAT